MIKYSHVIHNNKVFTKYVFSKSWFNYTSGEVFFLFPWLAIFPALEQTSLHPGSLGTWQYHVCSVFLACNGNQTSTVASLVITHSNILARTICCPFTQCHIKHKNNRLSSRNVQHFPRVNEASGSRLQTNFWARQWLMHPENSILERQCKEPLWAGISKPCPWNHITFLEIYFSGHRNGFLSI